MSIGTMMENNHRHDIVRCSEYSELDREEFPNEIATHECGHVVALAVAGLTDEFISTTIVPQNGVLGLTVRSGESLIKLNGVLSEYSMKLADGQQEVLEAFREFVLKTPDVCLPHICFFFGGGSIDRLLGRENADRNVIDMTCIQQKVVPAMLLPSLSDEDLTWVQEKVDEFLFNVFKKEKILLGRIYSAIVKNQTLSQNNIDSDDLREMQACAERSAVDYKSLLASVKEWYVEKVRQLPYFQV